MVVSLMSVLRTLYGCGQQRLCLLDDEVRIDGLTLVDARGERKEK
jgi:hypothetical protein